MAIVIGLLTFILVLVSLFLILLVLVQLPKKEAGVGMAFGAGMSEMLLGAGSGNVLTRITKYTVGIFLGLSLILSVLISGRARETNLGVSRAIEEQARNIAPQTPAQPAAPAPLRSLITDTNAVTPIVSSTSTPPVSLTLTSTVINPPSVPATTPAPVPATEPAPTPLNTNPAQGNPE
jgi:preprotein translocase subunit SecG